MKPKVFALHIILSDILRRQRRFGESNKVLISKLIRDPESFKIFLVQLVDFQKSVKAKKDESIFNEILFSNLTYHTTFLTLSFALMRLNRLKEAEYIVRFIKSRNNNIVKADLLLLDLLKKMNQINNLDYESKKSIRKYPNHAALRYQRGLILQKLGKLKESECELIKAIEIDQNYADAYFSLSLQNDLEKLPDLKKNLFNKQILESQSHYSKISILFARSNIMHKNKEFKQSSIYLKEANDLNLKLYPSNKKVYISQTKKYYDQFIKWKEKDLNLESGITSNIFIIGLPRCGSTLIESILSANESTCSVGESGSFRKALIWAEKSNLENGLDGLQSVYNKLTNKTSPKEVIIDKKLSNYIYTPIIARHIHNCKVIYCHRNPLDHILSIYRTHFGSKHTYSSSLSDCCEVLISQHTAIEEYSKAFPNKIYKIDYNKLVLNTIDEITSLISWLGWDIKQSYFKPHLVTKCVNTASLIQVRSPINSRSVDVYKAYQTLLEPAQGILSSYGFPLS